MALAPVAPIDGATLAYVTVALAAMLALLVLMAGRRAEYDSGLRSPTGRADAHGEAS